MTFVWLGIGLALSALAMTGPLRWAVAIVIFFLPFAATQVYNVGGDPVLLPLVIALGFIARHAFTMLVRPLRLQFFGLLQRDWALLAFVAYVIVSGLFFPRLFAGATVVTPQVYGPPVPLGPALVSLPQIAYVIIAAYLFLALRQGILRVGLAPVMYGVLAQIAFIGGIGAVQMVVGKNLPLDWIVNAQGYGLLVGRMESGFVRVNSIFVEPSAFGTWGAGALAFCYALYINRIRPQLNLAFVAVLGLTMLLSTSSTAYAGLLCVGGFAALHAAFDNDARRRERGLVVVVFGGLAAAGAAALVFTAEAGFLGQLRYMIERFTIDKAASSSGVERSGWAARSIQNAWDTGLLGVGYGAARSSGLLASLFGLVGAPGLVLFLMVVLPRIFVAFKRPRTGEDAVVCAGAFGLFGVFATMALVSPDLSIACPLWLFLPIAAAPVAQRAAQRAAAQQRDAPDPQPRPA